jgi:hypothetical protein
MTRSRLSRAGARRKIGWQHNEAVSLVPKLMLIHRSKNSVFGAPGTAQDWVYLSTR